MAAKMHVFHQEANTGTCPAIFRISVPLLSIFLVFNFMAYVTEDDVIIRSHEQDALRDRVDDAVTELLLKKSTAPSLALEHPVKSRFDMPWQRIPKVRTKSLKESRNRILYSPIAASGTSGIGHVMATVNAEITTALGLGLTYTHRKPSFGLLTKTNPNTLEDFFGWGENEIPRVRVQTELCQTDFVDDQKMPERVLRKKGRQCPVCHGLSTNSHNSTLNVVRTVNVPHEVSFRDQACKSGDCAREFSSHAEHNLPNTLLLMSANRCGLLPAMSNFSQSAPWFYWKYWSRSPRTRRGDHDVTYRPDELNIAVHIRRGDFLSVTNRDVTKSHVFAKVIRSVQSMIQRHGGPFASLPVAVHIYSEGKRRPGSNTTSLHNIDELSNEYVDSEGVVRDVSWWRALLEQTSPQSTAGNNTLSSFNPVRIVMKISVDTIVSLHEMIAADVFVGSRSGLSWNVVGSLSRGLQLHPVSCGKKQSDWRCFDNETGEFNETRVLPYWDAYAKEFENTLPAMRELVLQSH